MADSTGLTGLDKILHNILPGDNIVWQTDSVDDFMPYVKPYCDYARDNGRKLVYFRFAKHKEFTAEGLDIEVVKLDPQQGFEQFISKIHEVIGMVGNGGYYIFDSLSELAVDHFSEAMIENFFVLTCPRLLRMECIAYFVITRNYNLYHATQAITQTTQLILDVYDHAGNRYLQPVKVDRRYSPTMFMLHRWEGDNFLPVVESREVAEVMAHSPWYGLQSAPYRLVGLWDRLFIESEDIVESAKRGECSDETVCETADRQLKQIISTDPKMVEMARKHLKLPELVRIWKRTIGSGMIGGKSVGMLMAHSILRKEYRRYDAIIEDHDSFYIGSDVFYTFLVQNGCWHIRQNQKYPKTMFDSIDEAQHKILNGKFRENELKRFSDMLDYFGQSPIIVRSSSLLEDNFGNAFSGKYESVFCVNNGTKEQRLEEFLHAIRVIYASTMSREALSYRMKRNVLDQDEQMALLVQRVSGSRHNKVFLPQLAGVGFSYNSYTWDEEIDPEAGMLRLVFGLGTRAVDRHDDDYTRIVALNAPEKRPEGGGKDLIKFTQKRVDALDLEKNRMETAYFSDILKHNHDLDASLFTMTEERGDTSHTLIDFSRVIKETGFISDMREMLKILRGAYGSQVDIEFTANFSPDGSYRINLLQCRPQHVRKDTSVGRVLPSIEDKDLVLKTAGGIVGQGRTADVDRIIYVVPSAYGKLSEQQRYEVARLVGKLARDKHMGENQTLMLLGPGRWGTKMPSLGVPVSFSEINNASIICEIGFMHEGLAPDLSMGTHFFNDMVELNILYIGFFPTNKGNVLNEQLLSALPDSFLKIVPDEKKWAGTVRVIESKNLGDGKKLLINADAVKQLGAVWVGR